MEIKQGLHATKIEQGPNDLSTLGTAAAEAVAACTEANQLMVGETCKTCGGRADRREQHWRGLHVRGAGEGLQAW